jgi:hypothetical protein
MALQKWWWNGQTVANATKWVMFFFEYTKFGDYRKVYAFLWDFLKLIEKL